MKAMLILSILWIALGLHGDEIRNHPYFREISGTWTGEGSLVNADGETTPILEDWTGRFNDEGGFSMEGTRQWGDESQEFRWVFLRNEATELYECEYWHSGMEDPMRFEVQLEDSAVSLTTPVGEGELKVANRLDGGRIEGSVLLTGANGEVTLRGEVVHRKKPSGE